MIHMIKTKKMPIGSDLLLVLMDVRNRINVYDLDQADKIPDLIKNQLDDMTPIITPEPDWICSVMDDEAKEMFERMGQPILFTHGVWQNEILPDTHMIKRWSLHFAYSAVVAQKTIKIYINTAGGGAK